MARAYRIWANVGVPVVFLAYVIIAGVTAGPGTPSLRGLWGILFWPIYAILLISGALAMAKGAVGVASKLAIGLLYIVVVGIGLLAVGVIVSMASGEVPD